MSTDSGADADTELPEPIVIEPVCPEVPRAVTEAHRIETKPRRYYIV